MRGVGVGLRGLGQRRFLERHFEIGAFRRHHRVNGRRLLVNRDLLNLGFHVKRRRAFGSPHREWRAAYRISVRVDHEPGAGGRWLHAVPKIAGALMNVRYSYGEAWHWLLLVEGSRFDECLRLRRPILRGGDALLATACSASCEEPRAPAPLGSMNNDGDEDIAA